MATPARQQETRRRILDAAAELFAVRGFKRVTIRDICRAAHANVAAVNYHFSSKLGLYREVVQMGIDVMRDTTRRAQEAGAGRKPDEQLNRYLHVYLGDLLGKGTGTWLHRFMAREMHDPTPALDAIVEQAVRPRFEYICQVVGAMLVRPPDDPLVRDCVASIHAQCLIGLPHPIGDRLRRIVRRGPPDVERLAHHIYTFSVAGIRAVGRAPAIR